MDFSIYTFTLNIAEVQSCRSICVKIAAAGKGHKGGSFGLKVTKEQFQA